jgi:2-keto-3-deoxy-L-rhamnonate aldolase
MASPSAPPPRGVYVPVPTFFTQSTSSSTPKLDTTTQISHALQLAKSGVTGLVLLGSSGEAIHLSSTERKYLISSVAQGLMKDGYTDFPLVAGVLTNSTEDAVQQLVEAQEAGARWGMVLAPGYFGAVVKQSEIVAWYTEVADASPIPILL